MTDDVRRELSRFSSVGRVPRRPRRRPDVRVAEDVLAIAVGARDEIDVALRAASPVLISREREQQAHTCLT